MSDDIGNTPGSRAAHGDDRDEGAPRDRPPPTTPSAGDDLGGRTPSTDRRIDRDPSSARLTPTAAPDSVGEPGRNRMLDAEERDAYERRWDDIQVRFVDEPQECVREADALVEEVTDRITERFTDLRKDFERRWKKDEGPTTEELRHALQRYRDFFQRLVAE